MVKIDCLRTDHRSGKDLYPLFLGFMSAKDLAAFSEAPQFGLKTPHEVIAGNAVSSPVREWQRPLDPERVSEITRTFSRSSEIMPNAVLLAAPDPHAITLVAQGGGLWTLELPPASKTKPLWILDGQHRIAGLAGTRSTDEIPFVLLASHGSSAHYQDSTFAKIFAQVTTTAEGLHALHDEWLTFAFKLGKYDTTSPKAALRNSQQLEAMQATVFLCHERYLDTAMTKSNPFFDRVAFNPMSYKRKSASPVVGPINGGFTLDAIAFQQFVASSYYSSSALPYGKLAPDVVAREIALAYEALVSCHKNAHRPDSVLLNLSGAAGSRGHKALQEGFLHGVLRYLAVHGVPVSWEHELKARAFDTTDWRFATWAAASRSGAEGTLNKKLARSVFESLMSGGLNDLFLPGQPIPASVDLADYFKGLVGWAMQIQGRRRNANGRLLRFSGATDPNVKLMSGTTKTKLNLDSYRTLSIGGVTPNVISVSVADVARPFEKHWKYKTLRSGLLLTTKDHLHSNPVAIRLEIMFYGGETKDILLSIDWV